MANRKRKTASGQELAEPYTDGDPFEPPCHQLASSLRQKLATGLVSPGNRIPSDAQICEQYGVSPITARRAVLAENAHLLEKRVRLPHLVAES